MTARHQESALVPHARYWDTPSVVDRQHTRPYLYWYERELLRRVALDLAGRGVEVRRVHVIGCGAGREVPLVCEAFPRAVVVASDIAPRMVEACAASVESAGLADRVTLRCAAARELESEGIPAQLVLALNNVLTYVTPQAERDASLGALRRLLAADGMLAGVVHHRWGRVTKSAWFLGQELARSVGLARDEPGDRVTRFDGMPVRVHYFTRDELRRALLATGFAPAELRSLAELAADVGRGYHAAFGYNNLVFSARVA